MRTSPVSILGNSSWCIDGSANAPPTSNTTMKRFAATGLLTNQAGQILEGYPGIRFDEPMQDGDWLRLSGVKGAPQREPADGDPREA